MLKDVELVKPEFKKFVSDKFNEHQNFFKHADRDPHGEIELNAEITESMLIDAWAQYERLGGSLPEAGKVFKLWTGNLKSDALPEVKWLASVFKELGRQQFYETLRKVMRPTPTG